MLCSNAEGASLRLCNFEDPSGLKANLEGEKLSACSYLGTIKKKVLFEVTQEGSGQSFP